MIRIDSQQRRGEIPLFLLPYARYNESIREDGWDAFK